MPTPVLRNKAFTSTSTTATSVAITMPTHQAGDLLIVAATADGTPTLTTSSTGWVKLDGSINYAASGLFAKVAESASEAITVASTASEIYRATAWAFTGHAVTDVTTLETSRAFGDVDASGDLPAISLAKSAPYYVVAVLAGESGGSTTGTNFIPSGVSSPWTNFTAAQAGSANEANQASADQTVEGPISLPAGTWTRASGSTRGYFSNVVAIPGAPNIPPSSGTVTAISTVAGSGILTRPASGRVDTLSASAATVTKLSPGVGVVASQSAVTGFAEVILYNQVTGSVAAVSTVSGSISVIARATSTVTAQSTVVGNPVKRTTASSTVTATSAVAGVARRRLPATGQVTAFSAIFGALKMIEAPVLPPTPTVRPEATLSVAGRTLAAVSGDVTLDSARVPYAMSQVEVALTNPEVIETIDPRNGIRAQVTASDAGVSTRAFNLGVISRTVDHAAKTMTVELASDEALLIDYAPIVKDNGAFSKQASLRNVVNYVIGKAIPGASLAAGGPADVPVWVNYALNPTAEFDTQYWVGGTNSTAPARIASGGPDGGTYIYFNQHTSGEWRGSHGLDKTVSAGDVLTFEFDLRTHRDVDFILEVNASGTWSGPAEAIQKRGAGWSHHSGTITVNASGNLNTAQFYAPNASAGAWDIANLRVIHASVDRSADLLTWGPGTAAWDFLSPIVTSVGQKLWCDENRVWRLTDPNDYTVPGVLSVAGFNAVEGTDTITRSDSEVYCTGVVVRYRWRDNAGVQREVWDSAGVAGQVLTLEFERPYPGPGAAAAILTRRAGAGRVQEVTALSDYTATPGMEARITLPSTADQQGLLTSVSWDLTEGLMQVGTKGLLDLVKGSINALTGTIDQLTGTIDQL